MGSYQFYKILIATDNSGNIQDTRKIPVLVSSKGVVLPEDYEDQYCNFCRKNLSLNLWDGIADGIARFLQAYPEVKTPHKQENIRDCQFYDRNRRYCTALGAPL